MKGINLLSLDLEGCKEGVLEGTLGTSTNIETVSGDRDGGCLCQLKSKMTKLEMVLGSNSSRGLGCHKPPRQNAREELCLCLWHRIGLAQGHKSRQTKAEDCW